MPIIPTVGRRSTKLRLTILLVYLLLAIGGIAMIVPFMITMTQSVSNFYDSERYDVWPRYIFNGEERYLKSMAQRYDFIELFPDFRAVYRAPRHWGTFRDVAWEDDVVPTYFDWYGSEDDPVRREQLQRVHDDYLEWLDGYDIENTKLLFSQWNLRRYQTFLLERYGTAWLEENGLERGDVRLGELEDGALDAMSHATGTSYQSLIAIMPVLEYHAPVDLQSWFRPDTRYHYDYLDFMRERPTIERLPIGRHYLWTRYLFNANVVLDELEWGDGEQRWDTVFDVPYLLPADAPARLFELRELFLEEAWPVRLVRISADEESAFREFARAAFPSLDAFNILTGRGYTSWDDFPFHRTAQPYELVAERTVWRDYVLSLPRDRWELLSPEADYQAWLAERHGSADAVNTAYGWELATLEQVELPTAMAEYWDYVEHRGEYFVGFLTRNYSFCADFLILKGRAWFNTFVLVICSIAGALTVNPLAAYALSRFRPRSTHLVLIFLLAVMAFPPMVAAIPAFLLLRDLNLLNTYWALILPGLANGYAIFLLKGFFDSLPKELYEAATIDGAREHHMFLKITMPLCKPVLAVIALNTFLGAYGGFMWALIVCQKEEMWTIMVWMMQFQQRFAWMPFLTTAGMVLVSIPTLMVFMLCQKIILRGIIIPQMK